ncbi:MAG: hydantoinase/oxoprolinase family protein [Rhodospirillales bacterium]|jgi:N-methylhydantoinase A|nr:hydantoinase/oxoprolinase family protein [Rhodospirillales bacterium]
MAAPSPRGPAGRCRVGVDVGGTFTDFVLSDSSSGTLTRFKVPSVPDDPSLSVERGLSELIERAGVAAEDIGLIVHGTTLLVNAIIQRRGAKVGLVVSRGNRSVLEIGRANLAHTQDFTLKKEEPLVPRDKIFETSARVLADGAVRTPVADAELSQIAESVKLSGIEAVAVQLLNSYMYPDLEHEVAEGLRSRLNGVPVTESATIWPELGEFERALIAIMNAYVQPIMDDYLTRLMARVKAAGITAPIYITASNGGTVSVETARARPVDTVLSGPASGVVAALRAAQGAGRTDLITVDMGGTSCDVSVVQSGEPSFTTDARVGDLPLMVPVLDVSAIGAGGGSVVWVDPQGVLKIGPHSAGADPGPVCYGRGGTEPTLTDCYLLLGTIHPDHFLGGRMRLDEAAARAALDGVGMRIGLQEGPNRAVGAAAAALDVASAVMAAELQKRAARRGENPADFTLMAFGGAGPTHANLLADEVDIECVIVPPASSTFCALGAILADVKRDYVRSRHIRMRDGREAEAALAQVFRDLEDEAAAWLAAEGEILGEAEFAATLEMRYEGQSFELPVSLPPALARAPEVAAIVERFHEAHEKLYGFRDIESDAEITTERLQVTGRMPPVSMPEIDAGPTPPPVDRRRVYHEGAALDVPVFQRSRLPSDAVIGGPAIVEQEDSTTWILPAWKAVVDRIGNLILTPAAAAEN